MTTQRIGTFTFHNWAGDPPGYASEVVSTSTVPGQDGAAHMLMGTKGAPFTAELTAYVGGGTNAANILYALSQVKLLQAYQQTPPVAVTYCGQDMTALSTLYKVLSVNTLEVKSMPRAKGQGFDYSPAVRVRVAVTMQPHAL